MADIEIDRFLAEQRTCRVATVGPDGPHVSPLWHWWDGMCLWFSSVVRSQRWRDISRDPRIAVVIDSGISYEELKGVEIRGRAEPVGDIPRLGSPDVPTELILAEKNFQKKYRDPTVDPTYDGKHAWLRIVPLKIISWDFSKLR